MISVIICTYNRARYIYRSLECLAKGSLQADGYEIVLVDNNCTDNTVDEIGRFRSTWPGIDLKYFLETNQGLSFARNRGIRESKGDILVFLDDDAFVGEGYLATIERVMAENPFIDCFGGKITPLFEDGKTPDWYCKWTMSWVSGLDMGDSLIPMGKGYPIGANMGFRKEVFRDCGGFNTSLGRTGKNLMGGEEKDMFFRIRNKGLGIYYIPGIEVSHVIPASRTTDEFIVRFGQGVGMSEKLRCRSKGGSAYVKRLLFEVFKWCGTLVLWAWFLLRGHVSCGNKLVLFRWNVSKKLI